MIQVTRLNHVPLLLNSDLIEYVEVTPDTVITLTTGQKIVVRESAEDVVREVVAFRRSILHGLPECHLVRVGRPTTEKHEEDRTNG
jgi:flagellar protein FlbD